MAHALLARIQASEAGDTDAAWKRYVELLETDGDSPEAASKLVEAMRVLGKSTADAQADANALKGARGLQSAIAAGSGISKKQEEAAANLANHYAQTELIVKTRTGEANQLEDAVNQLGRVWSAAQRSTRELIQARQAQPKLLQGVPVPELT